MRLWIGTRGAVVEAVFASTKDEASELLLERLEAEPAEVVDVTDAVMADLGRLANLARERVDSADGTGRWRYRTINDVVKAWFGETPEYLCPTCDQPTTTDVSRAITEFKQQIAGLEARLSAAESAAA